MSGTILHFKKKTGLHALFVGLLFFCSCEKEVVLDIPHSPPQLVVSGILIPNYDIEVNVSLSAHIMDDTIPGVSDAEVLLFCDGEPSVRLQHTTRGCYSLDSLKAESGKTYGITVTVPGYPKARAETTVPYPTTLDSIVLAQNVSQDKDGRHLSSLDMFFKRGVDQENYYLYNFLANSDTVWSESIDENGDTALIYFHRSSIYRWNCYHPAILKEGNEETHYFSDQWIDGQSIHLKVFFNSLKNDNIAPDEEQPEHLLKAQILILNRAHYLYQKSWANYEQKQEQILGDNTLPPMYSNVDKALGCFSAVAYSNIITKKVKPE